MTMRRRGETTIVVLLLSSLLLFSFGSVTALEVGEKAPDFALPATTADRVSLADYLGKKHVVVFFYLFAFTNT
jgi:cytochrome oxidase Cu insertion factor (SCO1/SenC/PrrC family)